jgi:hypothetical protein
VSLEEVNLVPIEEHLHVVRLDLSDGAVTNPPDERLQILAVHANGGRLAAPSIEVRLDAGSNSKIRMIT